MGVAEEWLINCNIQTLKMEYSIVDSYCEGTVIFIVNANDRPLQSDTATT